MPIDSFAPDEIYRDAIKRLSEDRARLGGTNYVKYPGKNAVPMSALTQKARNLQEIWGSKPAPYSKKIQTIANRQGQGFSPQDIQGLLDYLKQGQESSSAATKGVLEKQFRKSYEPRADVVTRKNTKDITRGIAEAGSNVNTLNRGFAANEQDQNRQLMDVLRGLQENKQTRRSLLTNNMEKFGKQKEVYGTKVIDANKAQFDKEVQWPQQKMQMLTDALKQYEGITQSSNGHPDIMKSEGQRLAKAMQAYNNGNGSYPGELVAGLTPEMLASYNLLEGFGAKTKDNYSDLSKNVLTDLLSGKSTGARTAERIPEVLREPLTELDSQAKKRLKKDLGVINNQYIKLGQYGSPQHLKESERRQREINKSSLEARNKLLKDALQSEGYVEQQNQSNQIKRLDRFGKQGLKDFSDIMQSNIDLNKVGASKWKNKQDENEELYKNYQNERLWEWPHMRNAIRSEAHDEIFGRGTQRGIGLDEIANARTRVSELEREAMRREADYTRDIDYYRNRFEAQERAKLEAAERARREQQERDAAARAAREAGATQKLSSMRDMSRYEYLFPQSIFDNAASHASALPGHNGLGPAFVNFKNSRAPIPGSELEGIQGFRNVLKGSNYYPVTRDEFYNLHNMPNFAPPNPNDNSLFKLLYGGVGNKYRRQ